jgi:hypothetical protein
VRATGAVVTTARIGRESTGDSSAEMAFASWREEWKKRGRTSARFSGVMTLASSTTLVMQSLPSWRGATTSGYRWTRSAAVFR